MRPVKIQIRLRECAVWSESSLGVRLFDVKDLLVSAAETLIVAFPGYLYI